MAGSGRGRDFSLSAEELKTSVLLPMVLIVVLSACYSMARHESLRANAPVAAVESLFESRSRLVDEGRWPFAMTEAVDEVKWSRDKSRVAVVTRSEGHPILEIWSTEDLAAFVKSNGKTNVQPLRVLNPFPLGITEVKWLGDDALGFHSEVDFTRLDRSARTGALSDSNYARRWLYNLDRDEVHPVY